MHGSMNIKKKKWTNRVLRTVFGKYSEETCYLYEMYLHFLVQVSILFMSLHPGVLFRIVNYNAELQEIYRGTLHAVIMVRNVLLFQEVTYIWYFYLLQHFILQKKKYFLKYEIYKRWLSEPVWFTYFQGWLNEWIMLFSLYWHREGDHIIQIISSS